MVCILQNKILHSRLEALHIQLAEKDRGSAGISSGSTISDPLGDSGLQNVISYLRRSKEIVSSFCPIFAVLASVLPFPDAWIF